MCLRNKTILITGANGGLGRSFIQHCLRENAKKIYCCARNSETISNLEKLHSSIEVYTLDITDIESIRSLALKIEKIDILINNAGVNSGKRVFEESLIDFEVNVFGTLNVCRELRYKITKNGGAIINISSILALMNLPVLGLYSASKSALHSLTQAMRAELISDGIDVYEVLPGPIDTNMTKQQGIEKTSPDEIVQKIFEGYLIKNFYIYPDLFSKTIKKNIGKQANDLETTFAQSL